ncbi:bifunctional Ataxin2-like/LsmAD domain/Ataxin 2 [Babesia duncani]|uniref:Bifunctional Ataxin2-like/LsmAD domain/Ataxin 2 n=1 Tax=Babesia duncani TaxID=323732 RepID=A0AAD9UNY0_9APIC|nr:bifunctional Ataxin2-like/LsmAD domain/Ataxin 2 [Babesia duncani]
MMKNQNGGWVNMARINEECFVYAMTCLLGEDVTVALDDGSSLKGVFQGFDPTTKGNGRIADIALSNSKVATENDEDNKSNGRPMIVLGSQYSYIRGRVTSKYQNHFLGASRPSRKFKTDDEIVASKPRQTHEKLVEWRSDTQLDKDAEVGTKWNQFEVNSKQFGVTSTYDENQYTTPLDLSTIPAHVQDRAQEIEKEITASEDAIAFEKFDNMMEEREEDGTVNQESVQLVQKTISKYNRDNKRKERMNMQNKRQGTTEENATQNRDTATKQQHQIVSCFACTCNLECQRAQFGTRFKQARE